MVGKTTHTALPDMPPSEIDQLLDRSASRPESPLPSGFSDQVLHRARQVRDFSRRHRKLLAGVSALALALALAIAWTNAPSGETEGPPSLQLFRPGNPAQPFGSE